MDSKQLNYIGFGFSVLHLVEQISYCFSIAYATIYLRAVDFYVSLAMSASLFAIDYVISLALVKKKIWREIKNTITAVYITDIILIVAALLPVLSFYWPQTGFFERIPEFVLIVAMIALDIIKKRHLFNRSMSA